MQVRVAWPNFLQRLYKYQLVSKQIHLAVSKQIQMFWVGCSGCGVTFPGRRKPALRPTHNSTQLLSFICTNIFFKTPTNVISFICKIPTRVCHNLLDIYCSKFVKNISQNMYYPLFAQIFVIFKQNMQELKICKPHNYVTQNTPSTHCAVK